MRKPIKNAPEVRERAARLVREHKREPRSGRRFARSPKIGRTAETLRGWVWQTECDEGRRPRLTTERKQRWKALERENRELKRGGRDSPQGRGAAAQEHHPGWHGGAARRRALGGDRWHGLATSGTRW